MPLGHGSWKFYYAVEFGISRAQAYRLLDVARARRARLRFVPAGPDRRLRPYGRRREDHLTRRLAALAHSGLQALDEAAVRAVVRQAVSDVRAAPPPTPVDPPADPAVAALRAVVDELAACSHQLGELMLEVAPAYLSDTEAADVLALLCDEIGETVENGLAARRYALTGDRRALAGTLL
ncbi:MULTISPECIES: hypothetical protein [unclassified Streptomyces]|uniref:hypothetical protein n=1 Tax=unclassified Streptomyces TaxID=2593676 RepID=UPI000A6A72BB|nr:MULTISPECIES: hypothetical protein [unclassified Streptomyces]MYQ68577.1 hypothetical protein [Streptomyces sp. SID4950]